MNLISAVQNYRLYRSYSDQFKYYLKQLGMKNVIALGESEYLKKWSVFTSYVEPYSYRLYSHFMGTDADIIPEDIGHTYIENLLNPLRYRRTKWLLAVIRVLRLRRFITPLRQLAEWVHCRSINF